MMSSIPSSALPLWCYFISLLLIHSAESICYNVSYLPSGEVDITGTLYLCSSQIADPLLVPSYQKGISSFNVTAQLAINNLMSIDEINGQVTMDLFFRLSWYDHRWHMPNLFRQANPQLRITGVEIKDLIAFEDDPLKVWTPNDFTFTNLVSLSQNAETLKLAPGGFFFWSRHLLLELSQSSFDYHDYPMDKQQIVISFESYGLPANYLSLKLGTPPITYIKNGNGDINFQQNPIWMHEEDAYEAAVKTADYQQDFDGVVIIRQFQNIRILMDVARVHDGIMVRLAFPVLLLIFIGAITFWSYEDSRIDTTMNLLLAVSALYIVVFSTVPLLGYLTSFDRYFIELFILLTCCLATHQIVSSLNMKKDKWPTRRVASRFLEYLGRLIVMPVAGFLYLYEFGFENFSPSMYISLLVIAVVYAITLSLRELPSLRAVCKRMMKNIFRKLEEADKNTVSWFELLIFNFFRYGVISVSIKHYFKHKGTGTEADLARDKGNLNVRRFQNNDSDDEDEDIADRTDDLDVYGESSGIKMTNLSRTDSVKQNPIRYRSNS